MTLTATSPETDDINVDQPELKWIDGEAALAALEADWLDLEKRADRPYLYQGFHWIWARVQSENAAFRKRVRCITAWDRGALIAVWPFVVENWFGCRIASRLDSGSNVDYFPPLIDRRADASQISTLLYNEVKRSADILKIPVIKADDPLFHLLDPLPLSKAPRWESQVIILDLTKTASWNEFEKGLSTKLLKSLRYEKKRLTKLYGECSVRLASNHEEIINGLDFFLTKIDRNNKKGFFNWFHRPEARCFLEKTLTAGPGHGLKLLTAWAGERRIATALFAVAADRAVFFETTYDEALATYSPGKILLEGCLKWAIERRLQIDFGAVAYSYKEKWGGDELVACNSYTVIASPYGRFVEGVRYGLHFGVTRMRKAKTKARRYVEAKVRGERKPQSGANPASP